LARNFLLSFSDTPPFISLFFDYDIAVVRKAKHKQIINNCNTEQSLEKNEKNIEGGVSKHKHIASIR